MSWSKTLEVYLQKAHDVRRGILVLLPEAPRHVPVLAMDLEYMLAEIEDYEATKSALKTNRWPNEGQVGGEADHGMREAIGSLLVGLRYVEAALEKMTPTMEAALARSPRQRDLLPLVWNLRNALASLQASGPDGTHRWIAEEIRAREESASERVYQLRITDRDGARSHITCLSWAAVETAYRATNEVEHVCRLFVADRPNEINENADGLTLDEFAKWRVMTLRRPGGGNG